MHARITPFQMKAESMDAATRTLEDLKSRILALPGMQSFTLVAGDDGSGYVISLIDDEAVSNPGTDQIKAIWSEFGQHLAAPPEAPTVCKVIANWQS